VSLRLNKVCGGLRYLYEVMLTNVYIEDDTMQVLIMRKETLFLQAESSQARNTLLSAFKECIAFAGSCE
jgi:hypothetical protein